MGGHEHLPGDLPPSSDNEINLAIAGIAIYVLLTPFLLWTTWCHGKTGVVCWGLVVSHFGIHIAGDAYKLARRGEPALPDAFSVMANAGTVTCSSLALLGLVFEANMRIPQTHSRWVERVTLGVTHLLTTGGIATATYGGSPDAKSSTGVRSPVLHQTGSVLMISVLALLVAWLCLTVKRLIQTHEHANCRPVRTMCIAAGIAIPFQLVRLAYGTTFAFERIPSLDPFFGSFAVELVLLFGTQLFVNLALLGGGWLSRDIIALGAPAASDVELLNPRQPVQTDHKSVSRTIKEA